MGSLITTYGAQTVERRSARSQARENLRKLERALGRARDVPRQELVTLLDDFETSAMLAGLSVGLTGVYRVASTRYWIMIAPDGPFAESYPTDEALRASANVSSSAAVLLAASTWHPWLTAPRRVLRTRRLRKILQTAVPWIEDEERRKLREWERELLRTATRRPPSSIDAIKIRTREDWSGGGR